MIRKYLTIGKHLHLLSKRIEDPTGTSKAPIVELLLPLDAFWELEELLKGIAYLTAANEDQIQINENYLRVYRKAVSYATHEKDRLLIQERIASLSGNA